MSNTKHFGNLFVFCALFWGILVIGLIASALKSAPARAEAKPKPVVVLPHVDGETYKPTLACIAADYVFCGTVSSGPDNSACECGEVCRPVEELACPPENYFCMPGCNDRNRCEAGYRCMFEKKTDGFGICIADANVTADNEGTCTGDLRGCLKEEDCEDNEVCFQGQCMNNANNEPICGNGILEKGEECDHKDLNGMTCQHYLKDAGQLWCTSTCTLNTEGCYNLAPHQYVRGCLSDNHCQSGELCYNNGTCEPEAIMLLIPPCVDARDCDDGELCVNGQCEIITKPIYAKCSIDSDCPENQFCCWGEECRSIRLYIDLAYNDYP